MLTREQERLRDEKFRAKHGVSRSTYLARANPVKARLKRIKWRRANPEKARAAERRYYARHRDAIRLYAHNYAESKLLRISSRWSRYLKRVTKQIFRLRVDCRRRYFTQQRELRELHSVLWQAGKAKRHADYVARQKLLQKARHARCKNLISSQRRLYYKQHRTEIREKSQNAITGLSDGYVKHLLVKGTSLSFRVIPQALVELKRAQLKLRRAVQWQRQETLAS